MSERVSGDPVVLEADTDRTLPTLEDVGEALMAVQGAREVFEQAQAVVRATGADTIAVTEPHAPAHRMAPVLELLEVLDRMPAAFGFETFGDRAASAASATAIEGGAGAFGASAGAVAGSFIPIPVVGTAVGAALGAYLGSRGGGKARDLGWVEEAEEALGEQIDAVAGTGREPDRYDPFLDPETGDG